MRHFSTRKEPTSTPLHPIKPAPQVDENDRASFESVALDAQSTTIASRDVRRQTQGLSRGKAVLAVSTLSALTFITALNTTNTVAALPVCEYSTLE